MEAGLSKGARSANCRVRAGLPTWDRPASACLSSRIPYGTPVTKETIENRRIGEEEIEEPRIPPVPRALPRRTGPHRDRAEELDRSARSRHGRRFHRNLQALGFHYVTLDLEGYRQGSMNEVLPYLGLPAYLEVQTPRCSRGSSSGRQRARCRYATVQPALTLSAGPGYCTLIVTGFVLWPSIVKTTLTSPRPLRLVGIWTLS